MPKFKSIQWGGKRKQRGSNFLIYIEYFYGLNKELSKPVVINLIGLQGALAYIHFY